MLLWSLVGYMAIGGVLSRYLLPQDLYMPLVALLAGQYVQQEAVLAQHAGTELTHRLLGLVLLVTGMMQFDAGLRGRRPQVHRWSGRVFLGLAFVTALSGLIMALAYPFSGWQESIFVAVVSALLLWFTGMAWIEVRGRRFVQHRVWMIRSLGLLFFVAIQRLYYQPLLAVTEWPDRELFGATGWLSLLTVLIAAECWINQTRSLARSPA